MDGNLAMANSIVYAGPHDFEPEEWQDITRYEMFYQVSTFGRVRSMDRIVNHGSGRKKLVGTILKSNIGGSGYLQVGLSKGCKRKTFKIHSLMGQQFLGYILNGNMDLVIDHLDGNKLNNHVSNLRTITNRENVTRAISGRSSKHVGVCWHNATNKWMSRIKINGKSVYLGVFEEEYDAHITYQAKLKEITR